MKKPFLIVWPQVLAAMTIFAQPTDFPKLTGLYLGRKPPGKTPQAFAANMPEIYILHGMIRFSPDGKYLFFACSCGGSHTCWVEAGFIEDLRKKAWRED